MPVLSMIQKQHPLSVKLKYGEVELNYRFLPSKLSKPLLKKVQDFAASENWDVQADAPSIFLSQLIYDWDWVEEDPNNPGQPLLVDGNEIMIPVTKENLELLGFMAMKAISQALNEKYSEFMQEGEESSASSADQSQVPANVTSIGTVLSSPQETTSTAVLGS